MWYKNWAQISFVLSHSTRLIDGRTDGQTEGQKGLGNTVRCITCVPAYVCVFELTRIAQIITAEREDL